VGTLTDANYISAFVGDRLMSKGVVGSPISLQRLTEGMDNPDSKLVYLCKGRHGFVVAVSPSQFPDVVAEECLKAAQMRTQLGDLAAPILEPLDAGRMESCSYAVLPYRKPLSRRRGLQWAHRIWMKRHLIEWLLEVAHRQSSTCAPSRYEASLKALDAALAPDSQTAALLRTAEKRLRSGRFAARSTPMHGDLWKGNILHGAASTAFTLVDWRGSETQGYPLFDLIRAADSFGLSPQALYRELRLHRAALGCQMDDLPLYLLGALGHYAARLGEMSPVEFRKMCDRCVTRLSRALETADTSPTGRFFAGRLAGYLPGRHSST
jgi:Phosphotransferase enzyme family